MNGLSSNEIRTCSQCVHTPVQYKYSQESNDSDKIALMFLKGTSARDSVDIVERV